MRPKPPTTETVPRKTREDKETGSKRVDFGEYSDEEDEEDDVQIT